MLISSHAFFVAMNSESDHEILRALKGRSLVSSLAFLLATIITAASIVDVLPVSTVVSAQEDSMMDESRPHRHLYVGTISGVQFSGSANGGESGISEFGGTPDWILSGRWIARVQSSGEDLTVGFLATIIMIKPDGSAMHRHVVNSFKLSNVSSSEDNSTIVVDGTATVTMADGPVAYVPLTIKVYDESLLEILIGPDKVGGHFGANPIYGTFTYARTTFLDTGEIKYKQFSQPVALPTQAQGPTIPSKGYLVEEIRDGLYWVTDGTYNTMFLVADDGVAAVDAPPSLGDKYLQAITEVTDKPVKYVIYSHSHLDHIGAANMFPENATFIAQEEVANVLQKAHDLAGDSNVGSQLPPVPTVTFMENYTLSLGSATNGVGVQNLQLDYHGNNHEPGNIFIYAPNQKVLMLVDIVFPGWVPFMELAIAKDVAGFVEAHDVALGYDFDTFVGGHLTRLGTRQDVETQKTFVLDLMAAAGRANGAVSFADVAKKVGPTNDTWAFYGAYVEAVNEECTKEMLSKWLGKLGGAEAFMQSHCWTMTEAMRVDPDVMALSQKEQ
jgi:glyoxylase-like metal-dependent hydrolase (beta-lactamase superfamily II)